MYAAPVHLSLFFAWLVPLVGGVGIPLGVPPLPEDPVIAQMAPQECLFYMSSAGMAVPDPKSANGTEQLLAEPEVRAMAAAIEKAIREAPKESALGGHLPGVSPADGADVLKVILTKPMAVYASHVELHPGGAVPRGGLVINIGQEAATTLAKLDRVVKGFVTLHDRAATFKTVDIDGRGFSTVADGSLVWGLRDNYFVLAVGDGEMEAMLKRAGEKPPAWLSKLRTDLPLERRSTETYVNLQEIMKIVLPQAGPRAANTVKALGLDNLTTIRAVTGLDRTACVSKTLIGIEGAPQGLLRLADVKPLATGDLSSVPRDATFALAFRLSPEQVFEIVSQIVEKLDPRAKERMDRQIADMEEHTGLNLRDEILKPFGDTWTVFDSLSEGGILAGTTMVVAVKDAKQAAATQAKVLSRISQQSVGLDKLEFAGQQIYTFTADHTRSPIAPAWCLTEKELILALYPQSIKAYLSRKENSRSLADTQPIARAFSGDSGPVKLWYVNSRRVFDLIYPLLPAYTTLATRMARMNGIELNPSMLPSAGAIRPHLWPTVAWARRTNEGIEITQHYSLPLPTMMPVMSAASFMALPAVASSRMAARRMQSMNNMKQISLALLNYEQAYGHFPPAYTTDKNGKPLLSWRVLILPFIEQNDLYKQFHLDEPWDSDHNKKLIAAMPSVYKDPVSKVAADGKTDYLTVRGEKTIFPGAKGVRIADIRDGMSNTIMTVEVSDSKAVVWTKPDDFAYDGKTPSKGLIGLWPGRFHAGMADGSVRSFPAAIDAKTLNALFTRDGNESVQWQTLPP